MTIDKKRTKNPLLSLFHSERSNIIRLADKKKGHGDDVSIDMEALVTPVTIEIPAKMAAILEMNDKKRQVITGRENDVPYRYQLENGSTIVGFFPLEIQKIRLNFVFAKPIGKNDSEEWALQYGFPLIKSDGNESVDPDSILAAIGGGDYSLWKKLVLMSIISSLTSIGFLIKRGDINNPNYFLLEKQMDPESHIIQNRENRKQTLQSHKRMYKIPSRKRTFYNQPSIRRNRKFSRLLPISYLKRLILNTQKKTNPYHEIFNHSLQQQFHQNFSTNLLNFYDYSVAEVEIIQT
jgi:hypothetical protein